MSPTVFLGVIIVVIGLTIGTLLLSVTRTVRVLGRRGVPVKGRVTSVVPSDSGSGGMVSTVEYRDSFGAVHTTRTWGNEIPTDTVDLLMDPRKPARVTPVVAEPDSLANKVTEVLIWILIVASYGASVIGVVLMLRIVDLD